MKFKLDENIPISAISLITEFGYSDIESVYSEQIAGIGDMGLRDVCLKEQRILITLDNDFTNRILHPKGSYYGVILIKSKSQGKKAILEILQKLMDIFEIEKVIDNVITFDGLTIRINS